MRLLESQLCSLVRSGYATLQIPDLVINFGPSTAPTEEVRDYPDEWFTTLTGGLPSPRGYLFWSTIGWMANRNTRIRAAFDTVPEDRRRWTSWEDFCAKIEAELDGRRQAVARAVTAAERRIERLRSARL